MNIYKILLTALLVFTLSACGGDNGASDSNIANVEIKGNFTSAYYGKWLRVDTKEELNIISTTVINNYDIASENLIKVNTDDTTYYLMRAGLSNIVVKGTLEQIASDASKSASRSSSRIGGVNVILENLLDENIKSTIQTDTEGNFEITDIPSGTYNLSIDDENISTITISEPVEDIGNYKLTGDNLHNFKAELILDDEFLYADELVHTAKIRINNISNQVGYGLFYTLALNDEDIKSFDYDLVKGSVKAGEYIDIPVRLSFNQISKNSKLVSISVNITDVENNKWIDDFAFTLHKGYFDVNIATDEDKVKGYIIMPKTHKVKNVEIDGYGTIRLPLVSDEEYHLLLSNTSFENETAYSIGINRATQSFKTFNYTPAHEPNDREDLASTINLNSSIVSYLHATDLDYWKIFLPESEYLFDFTLGKFDDVYANLGEMITSNAITITDKLTQGKNISAEIDNGVLVINGVDTNSTSAVVKTGDTLAIKLKSPLVSGDLEKSTLLIGQNSLIFKIGIDRYAPIFSSPKNFILKASDGVLVTNIQASDEHEVTYSIVDGNDSNLFTIDSHTGRLTFLSEPDYELDFTYMLSIKATDILNKATVQDLSVVYYKYNRDEIGIVHDNYTGYMWQDNILNKTTFDSAINYCIGLRLGGYTDWTLPSETILKTIVDSSRTNPSISPIFQKIVSSYYWSSSSSGSYVTIMSFDNGRIGNESKTNRYYVRCARTGQ